MLTNCWAVHSAISGSLVAEACGRHRAIIPIMYWNAMNLTLRADAEALIQLSLIGVNEYAENLRIHAL